MRQRRWHNGKSWIHAVRAKDIDIDTVHNRTAPARFMKTARRKPGLLRVEAGVSPWRNFHRWKYPVYGTPVAPPNGVDLGISVSGKALAAGVFAVF